MYDIPPGSKLGVVRFGHTATTKLPLTVIPNMVDKRQRLATSSLPRNPSTVGQSQKCIICGLEEAVRVSYFRIPLNQPHTHKSICEDYENWLVMFEIYATDL